MTTYEVRSMYDEPPGVAVPRFTSFTRDCVGVLLGEIDNLTLLHGSTHNALVKARAEIDRLKAQLSAAYDRVAAQSELLSKRAEDKGDTEQP